MPIRNVNLTTGTHPLSAFALVCLFCLCVSGCQGPSTRPPPPSAPDPGALIVLEDRAMAALNADHLSSPYTDSAIHLFTQMLRLDPSSEVARRGFEQVIERYMALATSAADRGQFARSRSMLDKARLIDRDHPSIEPTATRVEQLARASRATVRLDGITEAEQKKRVEEMTAGASGQCRYTIAARNDAVARAVYRLLKNANAGGRPSARVVVSTPTRIEQICSIDQD